MPTTRPRHVISETPGVTRALDIARRRWPELADRPDALLNELILAGAASIAHAEREIERRLEVVRRIAGSGTGWFPDGYLEELRSDWPD
jgi:hypothetical protein